MPKVLLVLTEEDIFQNATPKVYARGEQYYEDGLVLSLTRRGRTLTAEVEGSEDEAYRVAVMFGAGGVKRAECTCPYEWEGWCKHIVAALLLSVREPGLAEERPSLQDLLKGVTDKQLRALLCKLAEEDPRFGETLALRVEQAASKSEK